MADDTNQDELNHNQDQGLTLVEPLRRAIGERYLTYALSTITHRALPDARDGLKPVHRRILFAMRELKLNASGGFRKSAKISGDVMGNYHPHGDGAIYDAMVRLAQDFNVRYPLVDGQGNFGNIDGDNPAASRYTEARLTSAAEALLDGLSENAVDFNDNYDGTLQEPMVLPAAFPNLLANGSSGIAVGMATNIPPHNMGELIDAAVHLIKAPNARDDTLFDYVPAPDFPTGGVVVESRESLLQTYKTGRGAIRVRARWQVEDLGRGQWQIVVDQIPYQVQKSRLIEKLAELINQKKLPLLADVRDESADDLRLILEPRSKAVDPEMLMELLFRNSDLEIRFNVNLNVLIDGRTPKVCSLKEVLRAFIYHRRDVLLRRSRHRMAKIDHRLDVLEGYIVAYMNLDRVIEIIRNEDDPKAELIAEFTLSDVQTEAILNMRLRSLRRLEEMELRSELDKLQIERADLDDLLCDETIQWSRIISQLRDMKKQFADDPILGPRRTQLQDAPAIKELSIDAMIDKEPITIVCSKMGWIRAMKGHVDLTQELKYKDGDAARFIFHAQSTDKLVLFGANGRFYTLACADLPGGRGMGEPVRLMIDLPNDADMVALFVYQAGAKLLLASSAGDGFIVPVDDVMAQTRNGKQVLNVKSGVVARACKVIAGDHIASVGENRKLLIFPLVELPEMTRGKGVRIQKLPSSSAPLDSSASGLADVTSFYVQDGLSWLDPAGRTRTETALDGWLGKRAGAGRMAPRGFPQDNRFNL